MQRFLILLAVLFQLASAAQKPSSKNLVYVDKAGVLRYTLDNTEAAFFGVNYTVPFAYGYRSHKILGADLEKAIDLDVYHMARLGLDAFRVHVWDVEISDSLGNLLPNEHLRLFDYLLKKLKERNIKILITPIAFWGNGYPEPDEKLRGFSAVYGKGPSVVKEEAFKAQENYLKQFFTHINPYTGLSYKDDPDVIAMEINNEPHHSGPKNRTTEYVNRMAAAVRRTGWSKPVFYNISESPAYADAVVKAKVDGHSFQWYPTGLVAGHEQKGNFLPNVDEYRIPFLDTIPAFRNRARMVYEFDAGDVMQPVMYPAMARSFRTAGFQWATQFAYDPLATAYANTEYQTHYLNLVYTPAKAISLLIASKVFHRLPRGKDYGAYPADTLFDAFRVSYSQQLSEMNTDEEFYYSNNTATQPKNSAMLKHIAGVGSSPAVAYDGSGAYFLDKVAEGVWELEILPDATAVADPFEKASPRKTATQVLASPRRISLSFLDAAQKYNLDEIGGDYRAVGVGTELRLRPGRFRIAATDAAPVAAATDTVSLLQFSPTISLKPTVVHQPLAEVTANKPFLFTAKLSGIDSIESVSLEVRNTANKWRTLTVQRRNRDNCTAEIPADMVTPGLINYRLFIKKQNGETLSFPGGFSGNPYAWDEYRNESWQTFVAAPQSPLELFNPATDRNRMMLYNPDWRAASLEYTTAGKPKELVAKATMTKATKGQGMGWQVYVADKFAGRKPELDSFTKLVVRARSAHGTAVKLSLITVKADAYAARLSLSKEWQTIEIPLNRLQKDSFLLLPRPYPGFMPLTFLSAGNRPFALVDVERLEISFGGEGLTAQEGIEIESVYLDR